MRATIALTALLMSSAAGLAGPSAPGARGAARRAPVQHAKADVQALADRMLGVEPERTAPQKKKPTPPGVAATSALTPAQAQPAAQKGDIDKLFALTEDKYRKGDVEGAIATLDRILAAVAATPRSTSIVARSGCAKASSRRLPPTSIAPSASTPSWSVPTSCAVSPCWTSASSSRRPPTPSTSCGSPPTTPAASICAASRATRRASTTAPSRISTGR